MGWRGDWVFGQMIKLLRLYVFVIVCVTAWQRAQCVCVCVFHTGVVAEQIVNIASSGQCFWSWMTVCVTVWGVQFNSKGGVKSPNCVQELCNSVISELWRFYTTHNSGVSYLKWMYRLFDWIRHAVIPPSSTHSNNMWTSTWISNSFSF